MTTRRPLRGITWEHPRANTPLVAVSERYAEQTGVTVEWESRSLFAFGVGRLEELARSFDLLVLDHPHVGDAAARGYLAALDELLPVDVLAALTSASVGLSHESYAYAGHQWAVAIDAAAQVSALRTGTLTRVPRSWAEVVDLARDGVVLWPLCPTDAFASLLSVAANLGTPCASTPGEFLPVHAGYAALEAIDAVARHLPRAVFGMDPIDVLEELAAERSRFVYCPLLFGYSNYARDGFRPHLVSFWDMPAAGVQGSRGSLLGGAGLAVSALSPRPDAATGFASFVAGEDMQAGLYFSAGGQPANTAAWESGEANAATHGFFENTRATLEGSWLRPRHHGFLGVQERGMELVHAYLLGTLDPLATIDGLNRAYRESCDE